LTYATHHNRLLSYEVYDTSDPNAAALLRTVRYTYYDTGQASNITVFDEQQEPDPNSHVWHHDVALHYYTHGPLKLAVWGKWQEDENGPIDSTYQVIKAREFRYDSARGRYLSADIATPQNDSQYWTLDGDPVWTDYEGDIPYADSTIDPSTYAATQVNRFFGLAGEKDTSSGDESYRQGDLIGSTMATTDEGGAGILPAVSYTAFGELLDSSGAPGASAPSGMPRYQYAGAWGYESGLITLSGADPDLPPITLQHLGWRWYQPDAGRFAQRDPIGVAGGINVFVYTFANPLILVDPTGLTSLAEIFLGLTGGRGHVPVIDPGPAQDAVVTTCTVVSLAAPGAGAARAVTMGGKGVRAAQAAGGVINRTALRLRRYIRLDRPHHGKGWHMDGKWFGGR
jgi:RHS repeat-associated protein